MMIFRTLFCALFLLISFAGCATLMPVETTTPAIPWESFDNALVAYEMVKEGETTLTQLEVLGFNLKKVSKSEEWDEIHVRKELRGDNYSEPIEKLPVKAQDCLNSEGRAWVFPIEINLQTKGEGNLIKRQLEYEKRDRTTGSKLWTWFCYRPDNKVVVYKRKSEMPLINELRVKKDKLAPIKSIFNYIRKASPF